MMLSQGDQAPAFELPDLAGQRRSLAAAIAAGPALVVFWKSSCGTCHLAFPYLQRIAEVYPAAAEHILAVSQDNEAASVEFAHEYGLTFPVLIEGDGWPVSRAYDPEATPTLFFIDSAGAIEMVSVGFYKAELNEIGGRFATSLGQPARTIAEDNDGNPPFKPG